MKNKFDNVFETPSNITDRDSLIDAMKKTIDKILIPPIEKIIGENRQNSLESVSSSFRRKFFHELDQNINNKSEKNDNKESTILNLITQDLEPGYILDK